MVTLIIDKGSSNIFFHRENQDAAGFHTCVDEIEDGCEDRDQRDNAQLRPAPTLKDLVEHETKYRLICRNEEDRSEIIFNISCKPRGADDEERRLRRRDEVEEDDAIDED